MLKFTLPATALLLAGCAANTTTDSGALPEPQPLPAQLRLVGEAAPGTTLANALAADGVAVDGAFAGRAEGIGAFCSGAADGLALSSDFTGPEAAECKALGGGWSALAGPSGTILYSAYAYADALIEDTSAF